MFQSVLFVWTSPATHTKLALLSQTSRALQTSFPQVWIRRKAYSTNPNWKFTEYELYSTRFYKEVEVRVTDAGADADGLLSLSMRRGAAEEIHILLFEYIYYNINMSTFITI